MRVAVELIPRSEPAVRAFVASATFENATPPPWENAVRVRGWPVQRSLRDPSLLGCTGTWVENLRLPSFHRYAMGRPTAPQRQGSPSFGLLAFNEIEPNYCRCPRAGLSPNAKRIPALRSDRYLKNAPRLRQR